MELPPTWQFESAMQAISIENGRLFYITHGSIIKEGGF